jgi:NAD(P)-dependent dehydrogenase (short-subunit alcohol dehydrogenase family)
LGLGIVKALLATYNANVVVLSRTKTNELSSLASPSLLSIQCDITQDRTVKSAIAETLKTFGHLNSIVLNAGTLEPVNRIENATAAGWQECFNINVFSNIPLVPPLFKPN